MKKGFTIVELLVVIFIISVLSSLSFASYRTGEKQFAIERSAQKLLQDIRRVQQMAMNSMICGLSCGEEWKTKVPPGGYGIYLVKDEKKYIIYADTSPFNPPALLGNQKYDEGQDKIIEEIYLEKGIKVDSIIDFSQSQSLSSISINFLPPDPQVTISSQFSTTTAVTINLSFGPDIPFKKSIQVNIFGLLEIK